MPYGKLDMTKEIGDFTAYNSLLLRIKMPFSNKSPGLVIGDFVKILICLKLLNHSQYVIGDLGVVCNLRGASRHRPKFTYWR